MSDDWPAEGFAARLADADRLVVLYHASWCPFSRALLREFDDLAPESPLPCAHADLRHPMDPRWDEQRVHVVPTVAYYEKGEELERLEAERGVGLARRQLESFLAYVESLSEEERPRWAKTRQPTSRKLRS